MLKAQWGQAGSESAGEVPRVGFAAGGAVWCHSGVPLLLRGEEQTCLAEIRLWARL